MKRLHWLGWTIFIVLVVLLGFRDTALASAEPGGQALEAEVDGYRIALAGEKEWAKGDNTIFLTLTDSLGVPVDNAEVALLITPRLDSHGETEASSHGPDAPDETTAAMEMGGSAGHGSAAHVMPASIPEPASHEVEASAPAARMDFHGQGTYVVQVPLASMDGHVVRAMVHVNGEMLEADIFVGGTASSSRSLVLFSFAGINAAILLSAALLRKSRLMIVSNGGLV